mmetsp:Transcript_27235/g.62787  ORF Transcript_27235/g.62787 Transcript_27235/m.62787 type:complete len:193 (-) Transcript_27235:97-675(-)
MRSRRTSRSSACISCMCGAVVLSQVFSLPTSWISSALLGRRDAVLKGAAALAGGLTVAPRDAHANYISSERFDGSYLQDGMEKCGDACARTINANGGLGMVRGRDGQADLAWYVLAEYQDKSITLDLSPLGGPKKYTGKWVKSLPKSGEKGILWEDGKEWEKMEYKLTGTPYGVMGANSRSEAMPDPSKAAR